MGRIQVIQQDDLDRKVNDIFAGKVVRKDLVRKVKVGANVPVFVLEYLLGKYCASSDDTTIEMGLQVVNDTLAENYIRPDESTKAQSRVKEQGQHSFIDKVKVRLVDSKYWAEVVNFGHKYVRIPDYFVVKYERLLTQGIWAQIDMAFEYDEESGGKYPFFIRKIDPIQIATFDLEEYRNTRSKMTTDDWLHLLIRSMGYESEKLDRRVMLHLLLRLAPLCERNLNLIELGPRATGKSYAVQEISPYAALLTGPTTVANMFGHMSGRHKGMVEIWDAVAFDEVADLQNMPKEVITTLKTYCESGRFQRGQEAKSGYASLALFGNTNQPVDIMVASGHLFAPMPDLIRDDMAFLDRMHFYIPGWEIPKIKVEHLTNHHGFVVDYLAEAMRELRKVNFTESLDHYFSLGSHLNARDRKAVRKITSSLMKILYPHGEVTRDEMEEILGLAIEGRRRVKEQLKKMGSFEYYNTSFSMIDRETGDEQFVGVPEQGGRDLISTEPLSPGTVYATSVSTDGTVGLYRVEVTTSSGSSKLKLTGGITGPMKESITRAFSYLKSHVSDLSATEGLSTCDFYCEVIDLLGNRVETELGVAFLIASMSAIRKTPVLSGLIVLGDVSVQGNIKPVRSLVEPLQVAMDNGARKVLIPIENKRHFLEVSPDILENIDPIFYGDVSTAVRKGMGIL